MPSTTRYVDGQLRAGPLVTGLTVAVRVKTYSRGCAAAANLFPQSVAGKPLRVDTVGAADAIPDTAVGRPQRWWRLIALQDHLVAASGPRLPAVGRRPRKPLQLNRQYSEATLRTRSLSQPCRKDHNS
jgi:hypothetical protein